MTESVAEFQSRLVQAPRWVIGEEVDDLTASHPHLHVVPVLDVEDLAVAPTQHLEQVGREPDEAAELLGEEISLADAEPALVGELVLVETRRRQLAGGEISEKRQVVVGVADGPGGTRGPKIFLREISREDAGGGQVLDRLAEVVNGHPRCLVGRISEVYVERRHAALDVGVVDDHKIGGHLHGLIGVTPELLNEIRGETLSVELEVLELLGLHEAARALRVEHNAVGSSNVSGRHGLDGRKPVPDDLEHDVVARQCEDDHDHAVDPRREDEKFNAFLQWAEEASVDLGFSMLLMPHRDVELGDRLLRHQELQVPNVLDSGVELGVEMRASEAEDDADVI